jgi:hypothetical protein
MKTQCLVLALALLASSAAHPVQVAPDHEAIRYVGRFADDYRFGWTGCLIEVDFHGSELSAELEVVAGPEGKGGHYHPSVRKDREMAAGLIAEIKKETGWKPVGK